MRSHSLLFPLTAVLVLGLFSSLAARPGGVTPGYNGMPVNLVRSMPGCGGTVCHAALPNSYGPVQTELTVGSTSLALGGSTPLQMRALGGVQPPIYGGFCIETTAGTFAPSANCQVGRTDPPALLPVPNVITHLNNRSRTWNARFNAPSTPGRVDWYASVNTVENFTNTFDSWDFWQPPTMSGTPGIPFRLFVNAQNVTSSGTGCPGTHQLAPVIGAAVAPTLGAANFAVEVHNIPFLSVVLGTLGISNQLFFGVPLPLDLAPVGAPGCFLHNDILFTQAAVAVGGSSTPGGGFATIPWPLPNDPSLQGGNLYFQTLVLDPGANAVGLTASAGLRATLQ